MTKMNKQSRKFRIDRSATSKMFLAALGLICVVFYQNCGKFQTVNSLTDGSLGGPGGGPGGSAPLVLESDPVLKAQALGLIDTNCSSCHETANLGNVTNILDTEHLVRTGLITPGDPTKGRLVGSIADGSMPPRPAPFVPANDLLVIKNWISTVRIVTGTPAPTPPPIVPAGMTVASDPTLLNNAWRVLQVNCAGCHQSNSDGGISKIMNPDELVNNRLVTMGDPTKGRLIGSIVDRSMPAAGSRLTVSATDLQTLRDWITSMRLVALDPANPPPAPLPALAATYASISANILIPKCTSCHGAVRADDGVRYDTYAFTMRTVTAGNPNNSRLYTFCANKGMPDAPFKALNANELLVMQMWIAGGANP